MSYEDQELMAAALGWRVPRLKTLAYMTPEEAEEACQDTLYWAKQGLATSNYDRCDRCGERYGLLNPKCPVSKIHRRKSR